jgi:hypothetical protein
VFSKKQTKQAKSAIRILDNSLPMLITQMQVVTARKVEQFSHKYCGELIKLSVFLLIVNYPARSAGANIYEKQLELEKLVVSDYDVAPIRLEYLVEFLEENDGKYCMETNCVLNVMGDLYEDAGVDQNDFDDKDIEIADELGQQFMRLALLILGEVYGIVFESR